MRALRGILSTALTWAVAWIPLSLALTGLFVLVSGARLPPAFWALLVLRSALAGALNGAGFGAALAVFGRRRTVTTLSTTRVAACGAIGGSVFQLIVAGVLLRTPDQLIPAWHLLFGVATGSLLGALCATASLRLARRAPELPRERGPSVAEISPLPR